MTFTATAGQTVALSYDSITTTPANQYVDVTVYDPNGTQVSTSSSQTANTLSLPDLAAGTYTVLVVPQYAATANLQLYIAPAAALTTGTSASVSTSAAGESAVYTFSGTAGQNLSVGITNLALTPTSQTDAYGYVYAPDGTTLANADCSTNNGGGCTLVLQNLPATGTYTLVMSPTGQAQMSFKVVVSRAVTGTLQAGTPLTVSLSLPGQYALMTFAATAGQTVALSYDSITTTPANQYVDVTVYDPNGNVVSSSSSQTANTLSLPDLAAGTYTVLVVPEYAATANLQLYIAPPHALSTGTSASVSTSGAGESAVYTFSGTAGQNLSVGVTNLALTPTSVTDAYGYVYAPDGTFLAGADCSTNSPGAGCTLWLQNLPATGTYTLVMSPNGQAQMSCKVVISQAVTGTLTAGTPRSVSLSVPGQYALMTFAATAGQTVALSYNSVTTTPANQYLNVTVYDPNGNVVSGSSSSTGATLTLTNLVAGTYTVMLSTSYAGTASTNVSIQ
jgi:uncharacterized membrane protein